jgi:hypothetical protein
MKFLGGLYAVALPTAEYAVLYPGSHIESIWGQIDLPGFDIIEFDITAHDGGKLAGKAQSNDPATWGTWMWRARTRVWERIVPEAHGTYPCIFTAEGTLVLADPTNNGSQGWRYVDEHGRLVTGDDTLNAQRRVGLELGLSDLWEYSHFAGVTIGQGDPPIGCHVLIDGTRRMLEPGGTHFIRVKYAQGVYAISMTKLAENTSVIHRMTRAQLSQLPLVTAAPPPPPPVIPEPPTPEPVDMEFPGALKDLLQRFAARFPLPQTPGGGEEHENKCRAWCLKLAEQVRFTTGNEAWGVKRAAGPQSKDTIARNLGGGKMVVYDLMAGAGTGAPVLNADPHGEEVGEGQTFIPVNPVNHLSEAIPNPGPIVPTPGPVPDTELAKRLDAVEKRLQRLENAGLMVATVFKP